VTHLRQIMLEELRRRNFAETTIRSYLHGVEHFSRYFHRQPDQLGPEHIRQYQAMLFTKLKFSPNTVTPRLAALRFFYIQGLKRSWSTHGHHAPTYERRSVSERIGRRSALTTKQNQLRRIQIP
jgi:site-specific recombinase XerD